MEAITQRAKELAFEKHNQPSGAQRYGMQPYSVHLEHVVRIALQFSYYIHPEEIDDIISACYLHDTIEDTEITHNDLKHEFNATIADIVYRVSNERGMSKKEILFKTLPKIWESDKAIFVKLADRIANGSTCVAGIDGKSKSLYRRYSSEYPIFRFALRTPHYNSNDIIYPDMWVELDKIFKFF